MNAAEFWNDAKAAQKVIQESKIVRAQVEPLEDAIRLLEDSKVGYELAKEAGDRDMLAEVETDKATMELECFFDGTILKIYAPGGSQVALGAPLCAIGKPGEAAPAPAPKAPAAPAAARPAPAARRRPNWRTLPPPAAT